LTVAVVNLRSHVSRETTDRLAIIVAQIEKWQPKINLIAPSTLGSIWDRHIEDSLQLVPLAPDARRWLDLGSGGGFPGLVVAAAFAEQKNVRVDLVESNGKKCGFLRETVRLAGLRADVHHMRIEEFARRNNDAFDVISARALAPLPRLIELAHPFLAPGTIALFPKGQDVETELAEARQAWNLEVDLIQSQTEPGAAILRVRAASRSDGERSAAVGSGE